jgi:hypothetical protein
MTDEMQNEHTPGVEFEREDLGARSVFEFLIGVAVMVAVASLLGWGIYRHMDTYQRAHQPVQNPLVQNATTDTRVVTPSDIEKFPPPRLEKNERLEITDFRLQEERTLNSYGWVDEKAGVVHIPIERAMQLVAERGLPVAPKAGTVPPSPVNVARKAAVSSDTSGQPHAPGKKNEHE